MRLTHPRVKKSWASILLGFDDDDERGKSEAGAHRRFVHSHASRSFQDRMENGLEEVALHGVPYSTLTTPKIPQKTYFLPVVNFDRSVEENDRVVVSVC